MAVKTLFRYVQDSGGISSVKLRSIGYTTKETFIQNGLLGVFRKHGRSLDDLATELIGMGIISDCPDDMSEGDWLMQLLIDERAGIDVLISRIEDMDYTLDLEEQRALQELREEMTANGCTEEEIKRAIADIPDGQEEEDAIEKPVEDPERNEVGHKVIPFPVRKAHTRRATFCHIPEVRPRVIDILRNKGHTSEIEPYQVNEHRHTTGG